MTKRVAVFTGTRADYGLLYWLLVDLKASASLELQLIVSGMHLSPEFGETWRLIEQDGFAIDAKVEMLLSSDSRVGVAKAVGLGVLGFSDALDRLKPDVLVILGDRFEAMAIAQTAMIMGVPIAHLHGGEITEGAYDDSIRHVITKMAKLHFVATDIYRKRVIQLGEPPENVQTVGALGLDHFRRTPIMSLDELGESIGFPLRGPFLLVTYHPVTAEGENPEEGMFELLSVLDECPEYQVIITYPNADNGGRALILLIESYAKKNPDRVVTIPSLGFRRYLAAMTYASAVVGNSSSGIIEAPSLKVPTLDIGTRQKGRLAASSVVHCGATYAAIKAGLHEVLSTEMAARCQKVSNPYGDGHSSEAIVKALEGFDGNQFKAFYDVEFDI
ncbi:UDP-N-acetylglucosamine 2-epimerase [Pseudomonas caspiana]|uniref:UDP-N-acetylglucosamine 2-epimerase n=1 Tax=Pseudomonas caspiana TaxID=1451454 RepID=UPI0032EDF415